MENNVCYINYNGLLDALFENWMGTLDEEQKKLFCKDGLIIIPDKKENPEYVNEKWEHSPRRVMFILKDKNTPDGDDIRRWLIDEKNGENNRNLFGGIVGKGCLPNIAKILYGLLTAEKDKRPNFDSVTNNMNDVRKFWNSKPFALIEAKKIAGFSTVSKKEIEYAINRDEIFLKKEIDILKPNIIVCCGADDTQFRFITEKYMNGKKHLEFGDKNFPDSKRPGCLWYYPEDQIAVIKSYHPTSHGKYNPSWKVFERVISPFGGLMKDINPLGFRIEKE